MVPDEPPDVPGLEQRREELYRALSQVGDFRRGSLNEVRRKCGKPNCVCAQPGHPGHGPQYNLTRSEGGGTVARHLRPGPELEKIRRSGRRNEDAHGQYGWPHSGRGGCYPEEAPELRQRRGPGGISRQALGPCSPRPAAAGAGITGFLASRRRGSRSAPGREVSQRMRVIALRTARRLAPGLRGRPAGPRGCGGRPRRSWSGRRHCRWQQGPSR